MRSFRLNTGLREQYRQFTISLFKGLHNADWLRAVSTGDQNDLQKTALVRAECEQIFEDTASGSQTTGAEACYLKPVILLWSGSWIAWGVRDLSRLVSELQDKVFTS